MWGCWCLLFSFAGPHLVLAERIGTSHAGVPSAAPSRSIGGTFDDAFIPPSLAGQRTTGGEEDDLVLDDDYDGRVIRRFHRLVLADQAVGKTGGDAVDFSKGEVVYQAFDAKGSRVLGSKHQHSYLGAIVPLAATPLVVAAGLKGKILGLKGADGSELLPGAGTLRYYDTVDGAWRTVNLPPKWYRSKKLVGLVMALLGASVAGLAASAVAAKREKSRLGLVGGPGTAIWDVSDCVLLVDVAAAEKKNHIHGSYVLGSATLTVDLLLQRARLRYAEKPPLLGNIIKRLRGKTISRTESFQVNTDHCYLRHAFRTEDGCTEGVRLDGPGSAARRSPCVALAPTGVFFRELLDPQGKRAEAIAIHLNRNPGWVRSVCDPALAPTAQAVAGDLDWSALTRLPASAAASAPVTRGENTRGIRPCKGSEVCEEAKTPPAFVWFDEVDTEKCRVIAAVEGHEEVTVWANYAGQQLFIGSGEPAASDFNWVRRVSEGCLLSEGDTPRYAMTRVAADLGVGAGARGDPTDADVLVDDTEGEAVTARTGYSQSDNVKRTMQRELLTDMNSRVRVGEGRVSDTSGKEEDELTGCSGPACNRDGARVNGDLLDSHGHVLAPSAVPADATGLSAVKKLSVFVIEIPRRPANWPKQVEIPRGQPGNVSLS